MKRMLSVLLLAAVALPLSGFGMAAGFGLKRAVVLTGSMEPTYPVGSITFVEPLDPTQSRNLPPGEPIMFWSPADYTQSVTHRVVEVQPTGLITRGDANETHDQWIVPHEAVLGRVVWHVPYIGYATSWLQQGTTAMVALGGMAALFILNEVIHIVRTVRTDRREKKEKEAAREVSIRPPDLDTTAVPLEHQAA